MPGEGESTISTPQPNAPPSRKAKRSIAGRVVTLVLATVAVLLAIAAVGDIRYQQQAMEHARRHAGVLRDRMADTGLLPLNLEPARTDGTAAAFPMEWLTAGEAIRLREAEVPVMAAQTRVQPMRLAQDGRAVILFEEGEFRVEWMPEEAFDRRLAEQRALLEQLERGNADSSPSP